ncbi:Dipeptidyl-peptidase 5 [Meiothermus luteus]|uniref:Dipeptidyl-peptidase 5 n=1 Tax=Meiothermus luteus TaxID=2026184 RepID=A0A399EW89_9DEIN|nr:PD40 domain-containing protein [Meiothermus luteus]RIH87706.1 Dipeptidyl-peptidase 5 [Meiothermus luteus]
MARLLPLFLWLALLGWAQFDPTRSWFTLRTEHFDVHYHPGLERVAAEVALYAEEAYALLSQDFEPPPGRLSLVVADVGDVLNGFADPTQNRVGIYTTQFRSADLFNPRLSSWWQTVVFHEVTHLFDLTQVRGPLREATRIFGQLPAQSAVKPFPLVEGAVLYLKYKKLGESRLNDATTRMMLRQMVLSGHFPSLDEVRQAYTRATWPPLGLLVYNYGAWLVRYLEERFGEDAYRRLTEANAGMLAFKDFNQPFQQAFGLSLDELYAEFVRWLPNQFEGEIARIRAQGLTPTERLTHLGFYSQGATASASGLVYAHASPLRQGLRILAGGEERELLSGPAQHPQWSPDGRYLIFVRSQREGPYFVGSDLYRYDRLEGRLERLTRGERVYYARYAPDGQSVFLAKNTPDGSTELARYFVDLKRLQPLRSFPHQDGVVHSFAVAPDGGSLVLALLRRGGFQDLYRYTLASGALEALTQDKNVDSDPVFSPDGRYVLYSSDADRVYNLYAYRLSDGAVFQVTNLLTGAYQPTFSHAGDHIVFTGYDTGGYNLYQVSYNPAAWRRVGLRREALPAFRPLEPARGEPYDPFPYLRPLYWLPLVGPSGLGLGASFSASDPVGLHAYTLSMGLDGLQGAFYDLAYRFTGLGFPLGLRLAGLGGQNAQGVGAFFPLAQGSLGLQYLRTDLFEPALNLNQNTVTHAVALDVFGQSSQAEDLFRSSSHLRLQGTAFLREGSPTWRFGLRGALGVSLRLPLEASHVFALRLAGGLTTSPLAYDAFDLGAPPLAVGGWPVLAVRGYGPGQLRGAQALAGSLEYRLPPWPIERGLGNWPVFLDDLGLTLFADGGVAGSPLELSQARFSLGAELRLGLTLFYLAPGSSLALGGAQGIGEPGPRFYLNLVLPGP